MYRIESLLSARSFLQPQLAADRIFFISNLSGHMSLYAMDYGGSVPEPLIPPNIALQNPHLIGGQSFYVFPKLGKILVMIDRDGDENYQPMLVPIQGGFPEPTFENFFSPYRVHLGHCDSERNLAYLGAESRQEQNNLTFCGNLATGELTKIGESKWGAYPAGENEDHTRAVLIDGYSMGDECLYLWEKDTGKSRLLYGIPIEQRQPGQEVPLNAIFDCQFTQADRGLLFGTSLFQDNYGPGYFTLENPQNVQPVDVLGLAHSGNGELEHLTHLDQDRYLLQYNIDGCSWVYEVVLTKRIWRCMSNERCAGRRRSLMGCWN